MSKDMQSVIIAVQRFKAWYYVHCEICGVHPNFRKIKEYYYDLPKPDGMDNSIACFEAVLNYPINDTVNVEENDLHNFQFGY